MKKRRVLTTVAVLVLAVCLFCVFATGVSAQGKGEKLSENLYVLHDARQPYSVKTASPVVEGELSIVEEVSYPADVFFALSEGPKVSEETILLSELLEGSDPTNAPCPIGKAFRYDYYDMNGMLACTATVAVNGTYYGDGSVAITSLTCSLSGEYADSFCCGSTADGSSSAVLNVSLSGSLPIDEKHYTVKDDLSR